MSASSFPEIILGGAPKCGTSTLFSWIAAHPDVCGSDPKETYFLLEPEHPLSQPNANIHIQGHDSYARFFPSQAGRRLEGTTHYLYSDAARERVSEQVDPPHVVFLLREPIRRLISSFEYIANNLARIREDLTFDRYVKLAFDDPGALQGFIYPGARQPVLTRGIAHGAYVVYLSKWREDFGSDRLHVVLFEDMTRDPRGFLRELFCRLDLNPKPAESIALDRRNPTLAYRSRLVHRIVRKMEPVVPKGLARAAMKTLYNKLNTKPRNPVAISYETESRLRQYYEPYNAELAAQFGLDLEPWSRRGENKSS